VADAYHRFDTRSLTESFSWTGALTACAASHLVYSEGDRVCDVCLDEWGFDDCEFIQVRDTECFVATKEDLVLVCYRGTAGVRDWLRDLTIYGTTLPYGRIHAGFYHGFAQARHQVETVLERFGVQNSKLVIAGHSLGGALATVAAAQWTADETYHVSSVYTFGQPAVGKRGFPNFVRSRFGNRLFRFVNDDDIVARVPPTYRHVGTLKKLDGSAVESIANSVTEDDTMAVPQFHAMQRTLAAQDTVGGAAVEGIFPSFSDHRLANYMRKIARNV